MLRRQLEVGPDPAEVRRAREWVRAQLDGGAGPVPETPADTVILLVSELVTNAVVHTGRPALLRLLLPEPSVPADGARRPEEGGAHGSPSTATASADRGGGVQRAGGDDGRVRLPGPVPGTAPVVPLRGLLWVAPAGGGTRPVPGFGPPGVPDVVAALSAGGGACGAAGADGAAPGSAQSSGRAVCGGTGAAEERGGPGGGRESGGGRDSGGRDGDGDGPGSSAACAGVLGEGWVVEEWASAEPSGVCPLSGPPALRLEVVDDSSHAPRRRSARRDDTSGRGLELVELLADRWGWQREGRGKRIWCELDLPDCRSETGARKVQARY